MRGAVIGCFIRFPPCGRDNFDGKKGTEREITLFPLPNEDLFFHERAVANEKGCSLRAGGGAVGSEDVVAHADDQSGL